jgi:hypothetical protein
LANGIVAVVVVVTVVAVVVVVVVNINKSFLSLSYKNRVMKRFAELFHV